MKIFAIKTEGDMSKGKRTGVDFSKHVVEVTESENFTKHYFRKPGTIINSVLFLNVCGSLVVKGDFGNWIFCREFHPRVGNYVSECYWAEKLEISSVQRAKKFSSEKTEARIKELINEEEDLTEEELEYLMNCLLSVYKGEHDYTEVAHRQNVGRFEDHEYVPFEEEYHGRLLIIFDAFDEICQRMKEESVKELENIPQL